MDYHETVDSGAGDFLNTPSPLSLSCVFFHATSVWGRPHIDLVCFNRGVSRRDDVGSSTF